MGRNTVENPFSTKGKIFTLDKIPFGPREVTATFAYGDLTHAGHLDFWERSRAVGNPLVVGLRAGARFSKWYRPIVPDQQRLRLVAGFSCVDHVFLDTTGITVPLMDTLQPKAVVFSSGETPSDEKLVEMELIRTRFPHIELIELPRSDENISTTSIVNTIVKKFPINGL